MKSLILRYRIWQRRRHIACLIVKQPVIFGSVSPAWIEKRVYGDNRAFIPNERVEEWTTAMSVALHQDGWTGMVQ